MITLRNGEVLCGEVRCCTVGFGKVFIIKEKQ